jgi:alkylhydroperoxidase/carboxymuconolactone decarboxylase family protein YurZ
MRDDRGDMDPLELLESVAPRTAAALSQLGDAVEAEAYLDEQTLLVCRIAIAAAMGDAEGVYEWGIAAEEAGVSRDRAIGAVLVAVSMAGPLVVWDCLPAIVSAYDSENGG